MSCLKKFILLLLSLLVITEARHGDSCSTSYDCKRSEYSFFEIEKCEEGRCKCKDEKDFQYSTNGESTCSKTDYGILNDYSFCVRDQSTNAYAIKCQEDQKCHYGKCRCKIENQFIVKKKCLPRTFVKPLEKCNVTNNIIYTCDNFVNNTICISKQCHCIKDHYYNFTSSSCETKKSFTKFHKISDYKALPKGYCLETKDCVDGLRCASNKTCACPHGCSYKEKELSCDCGLVEYEAPTGVFVSGIVLGICFSICWCCIIKKTIEYHKKESEEMGMRQMNEHLGRSDSSISASEQTADQAEGPVKSSFPNADDPPPYSTVCSYPLQPPNDNLVSNTTPYPVESHSAHPPPYPVTPPATDNPNPTPYPLNPTNQMSNPLAPNPTYSSNDQPAFNPAYPVSPQQPSAPMGFTTASAPPDLSFQTTSSMQPNNPYPQSEFNK